MASGMLYNGAEVSWRDIRHTWRRHGPHVPHHECEIAQSVAHNGHETVNYWMHNNMVTINGQKMGKSLGNFITLDEFFNGTHPALEQAYSPMTIRFFILQAHYRGTLDFSNAALQASEKALNRMLDGYRRLQELKPAEVSTAKCRVCAPVATRRSTTT